MEDLHKSEPDDFIIVKGARVRPPLTSSGLLPLPLRKPRLAVAAIEARDAVHSEEWKVGDDDFNQTLDTVLLAACSSVQQC